MANRKLLIASVLVPLTLLFAAPAFAEESGEKGESSVNETQALMNAKISVADAIRTAESEAKGKAVDSGLNDENGEVSYQVEIVGQDGKRTDVFVDLQSGKVLRIAASDSDEENTKKEEEQDEGSEENSEN